MLSKKTKYALKALIYLANEQDKKPVLISELAAAEKIPKKFLEIILLSLKNHGILRSKKGKGGGYMLGRAPGDISIGNIIRMFDGPLAPVPCVSEMAYMRCGECADESTCGIRIVMKEVRDSIAGILDGTSLSDMLKKTDQAKLEKLLAPFIQL
ncbi:MAG: Rrf2 family transcriptional regulator [Nitrospirota bacterium]